MLVADHAATGDVVVLWCHKGLLGGAMRKVQGFCDTQCPGVFEGLS